MAKLIISNEESCFLEAAYDYMLHTCEAARETYLALIETSNQFYRALPEEAHTRQEEINDVFTKLEDYTFLYAYGSGVLLASKMALGSTVLPLSEGLHKIVGVPMLSQSPEFAEAQALVERIVQAMKRDFPSCAPLVDRVTRLKYDLFRRQIGFDFLFGVEYGLTLYKHMNALKQEDETYIEGIYRLVKTNVLLGEVPDR